MFNYIYRLVENRKLAIKWILSFDILTDSLIKVFRVKSFKRY